MRGLCSPPAGKQWTGTARISGKYLKPAWLLPEEVKRDKPSLPNVIPVDAGYGDAEDRTPTHRYEATRRGAMHAFASTQRDVTRTLVTIQGARAAPLQRVYLEWLP